MATLFVIDRESKMTAIDSIGGMTVMEVVRDAGIDELLALCGGCCSCATCHIYVEGPVGLDLPLISADEDDLLDGSDHRIETSRLACQLPFDATLDGLIIRIAPED